MTILRRRLKKKRKKLRRKRNKKWLKKRLIQKPLILLIFRKEHTRLCSKLSIKWYNMEIRFQIRLRILSKKILQGLEKLLN
jgi:hypothetical protein